MGTDPNEVANRFKFHTNLSTWHTFSMNQVRERLRRVAVAFAHSLPEGREKSVAITKLEEAMFWANASISRSQAGAVPYVTPQAESPASIEDLAKVAYNAYGTAVGFKNFRGDPMPAWENLGTTIQSAWIAAIDRVRVDFMNSQEGNA